MVVARLDGRALELADMTPAEAAGLGTAFAAIDPWARYPYKAEALTAFLAAVEPGAPRFAVRLGPETAGALALRLNWLRGPYVHFLGIVPAHQGRGIGRSVMAWVESEARRAGERNLWVAASDFNAGALKLYRNVGFSTVAHLDDLVSDGRNEILLRKKLFG